MNRGTTLLTDSSRAKDAVAIARSALLSAARVCVTCSIRTPLLIVHEASSEVIFASVPIAVLSPNNRSLGIFPKGTVFITAFFL